MVNQVVRELTGLDKYTACVKVMSWTGKIRTLELREVSATGLLTPSMKLADIEYQSDWYLRNRAEIDAEINERQEAWKPAVAGEAIATHEEGEQVREQASAAAGAGMGKPPPQFS